MKTETSVVVEKYKDSIFSAAFNVCANAADAEDVVRGVPLEDYAETLAFPSPEAGDLFEKVMKLPEKYRIVIHLFYYEDYSVREIAGILRITEANVKVRLSRGRRLLKEALQEVWTDE